MPGSSTSSPTWTAPPRPPPDSRGAHALRTALLLSVDQTAVTVASQRRAPSTPPPAGRHPARCPRAATRRPAGAPFSVIASAWRSRNRVPGGLGNCCAAQGGWGLLRHCRLVRPIVRAAFGRWSASRAASAWRSRSSCRGGLDSCCAAQAGRRVGDGFGTAGRPADSSGVGSGVGPRRAPVPVARCIGVAEQESVPGRPGYLLRRAGGCEGGSSPGAWCLGGDRVIFCSCQAVSAGMSLVGTCSGVVAGSGTVVRRARARTSRPR
jgi:hypothetical protein